MTVYCPPNFYCDIHPAWEWWQQLAFLGGFLGIIIGGLLLALWLASR